MHFTLPLVGVLALLAWLIGTRDSRLLLLLPGIIALPIYAMLGCLGGHAVPLSLPGEEAKSAGRGVKMIGTMVVSAILALIATVSWNHGWFKWLLLVETISAIGLYFPMRSMVGSARWTSLE